MVPGDRELGTALSERQWIHSAAYPFATWVDRPGLPGKSLATGLAKQSHFVCSELSQLAQYSSKREDKESILGWGQQRRIFPLLGGGLYVLANCKQEQVTGGGQREGFFFLKENTLASLLTFHDAQSDVMSWKPFLKTQVMCQLTLFAVPLTTKLSPYTQAFGRCPASSNPITRWRKEKGFI